MVLGCACLIAIVILVFLKPLATIYGRVVAAETAKQAALGETVFGVRTVKSLAIEPQRKALWDERIAEAGKWRLAYGKLGNWPQTLVTPIERFMWMGVILLGVYWALNDPTGAGAGALFAFMMLSQRVAQPLVQLAKLTDEYQDVAASIGQAASVLNRPLEADAASGGMRPRFDGAISFDDVTFTYGGTKVPALDRITFSVPAGTMLGIVGRIGFGQIDHHPPAARHQPRLFGLPEDRRLRPARDQPAASAAKLRHRAAGQLPVPRLDPRQHPRRPARPDARGRGARGTARGRRGIHRAHAERV